MPNTKFDPSRITPSLLRELGQLSWYEEGPRLAVEFLAKYGIALVVEPRLPNTRLDGAAMLMDNMMPVIGLTLRFPRVDYFWFTLLHELAHVWKHLNDVNEAFIDRVENIGSKLSLEKEANRIARDALIPRAIWKRSAAFLAPTKQSIFELADQFGAAVSEDVVVDGPGALGTDQAADAELAGLGEESRHWHFGHGL